MLVCLPRSTEATAATSDMIAAVVKTTVRPVWNGVAITFGADLIERTLFNGFLAGLSLDGRRFNYVNSLHARSGHERQEWFEIACCPPNVMRTLASLDQYIASESAAALHIHQYASSRIQASGRRAVQIETDYPWNGDIEITVTETPGTPWAVALRISAWAKNYNLSVNGVSVAEPTIRGYVTAERDWRVGDKVSLRLPVRPRLTVAAPKNGRDPRHGRDRTRPPRVLPRKGRHARTCDTGRHRDDRQDLDADRHVPPRTRPGSYSGRAGRADPRSRHPAQVAISRRRWDPR
ncbi:MAG: uncharacterized protein QOG46_53 [Pseudonocardiales bacterium]|nr:uncharacterized protein [Pseudonocardiales bacterium]